MASEKQHYRQLSLKERAAMLSSLSKEPGWELLKQMFRPEIRTRISDTDAREAFIYEAIRAQVIQEIFGTPLSVMYQAEREWCSHPVNADESNSGKNFQAKTKPSSSPKRKQ